MYPNWFIVYDLETGGLIENGIIPPITEFAACVVDNDLNDVCEVDFFVKPYVDESQYKPKALEVSNITLDLCRDKGLDSNEAAKKIADLFLKAKSGGKKPILVGHNIDSFDNIILNHFLSEHGYDLSKVADSDFTIDTKWWGRMAYPQLSGYKLSDCLAKEAIDNEMAHRAIGDTRANKELFVRMMKRLRGEGGLAVQPEESFRKSFRFQIAQR